MFDGSQIINYCRSIFGHITVEASLDILGGLLQAVHKQASLKGSYTTIHEMIESPFDAFSLWHVQDHIISKKSPVGNAGSWLTTCQQVIAMEFEIIVAGKQ